MRAVVDVLSTTEFGRGLVREADTESGPHDEHSSIVHLFRVQAKNGVAIRMVGEDELVTDHGSDGVYGVVGDEPSFRREMQDRCTIRSDDRLEELVEIEEETAILSLEVLAEGMFLMVVSELDFDLDDGVQVGRVGGRIIPNKSGCRGSHDCGDNEECETQHYEKRVSFRHGGSISYRVVFAR